MFGWLVVPAFLKTMPSWVWKLLAVVLVLIVVYVYGYNRGSVSARLECEAQAKRAQNAADAQDLAAEREGRQQEKEINEALTQQKKVDDETIARLEAQLKARVPQGQTDPCVYDKSNADPDEPAPSRMRNR